MSETTWKKSSFSGGGGNNCIEIAALGGAIGLRESDDPGVVVTTTPAHLRAWLRAIKRGQGPAAQARQARANTM